MLEVVEILSGTPSRFSGPVTPDQDATPQLSLIPEFFDFDHWQMRPYAHGLPGSKTRFRHTRPL
jgi:hypothetical protein